MNKRIWILLLLASLLISLLPIFINEAIPTIVVAADLTSPEIKELFSLRIKDAMEGYSNLVALSMLNDIKSEIDAGNFQ